MSTTRAELQPQAAAIVAACLRASMRRMLPLVLSRRAPLDGSRVRASGDSELPGRLFDYGVVADAGQRGAGRKRRGESVASPHGDVIISEGSGDEFHRART